MAFEPARIALVPSGSRGDFQPYVALGWALQGQGCIVKFFLDEDNVPAAQEMGFDTVAVRGGMQSMITNEDTIELMTKGGIMTLEELQAKQALKTQEETDEEMRKAREWLNIQEAALLEFAPVLMVANTVCLPEARMMERKLKIPMVTVHFSPQHLPSEEFLPLHLPAARPEPDAPNSVIWAYAVLNSVRQALQEEADMMQSDVGIMTLIGKLGNAEFNTAEMIFDWSFRVAEFPLPVIFAYSTHFWTPPAEWQEGGYRVVGNWRVRKDDQHLMAAWGRGIFGSSEELQSCVDFLAAGPPPVYVGWGSMVVTHPLTLSVLAVRALKLAGQRGVCSSGWAKLSVEGLAGAPDEEELRAYCAENVLVLKSAPHEWLLPQCACAVHHGGCGTCQVAMASGCPSIVTPVMADQPSNGARLESRGTGFVCCHLSKVTPEGLAEKIRACVGNEEMKANCMQAAAAMAEEDGTQNMVNFIWEAVDQIRSGKWQERWDALAASQWARREKRAKFLVDAGVATIDRGIRTALPLYKQFTERQTKQMMEFVKLMKEEKLWTVKASTGVVARRSELLKSPEVGRLLELAILELLEQKGQRIRVKRLRGEGPDEGWVSTTVSGREVVSKLADVAELQTLQTNIFMHYYGTLLYYP